MKQLMMVAVATLVMAGCRKSGEEAVVSATPSPLPPSTLAAAVRAGTNIVAEAFELLSSNLQSAIQQGGISNALPYCSVAALPLTRSTAESRGAAIRRFTHRPRNPQGRAEGVELAVIGYYQEAVLGSNSPAPFATNIAPGTVTFFAPIVLNNPLCLKCHGEAGNDILPEDVAIIDRLYPQDQAKGFKLGELRGAWRVDFSVSALQSRE